MWGCLTTSQFRGNGANTLPASIPLINHSWSVLWDCLIAHPKSSRSLFAPLAHTSQYDATMSTLKQAFDLFCPRETRQSSVAIKMKIFSEEAISDLAGFQAGPLAIRRGWIGFWIDGIGLKMKSVRIVDFCGKSKGFAELENSTVDRGSAVNFGADSGLCLSWWKPNWDHRLFFAGLGWYRYVNDVNFFFERTSFKLKCETVIGIVLCYSHQACCLLYYLREIVNGIHIYQFFEPLHLCFQMWFWFRIKKILAYQRIWKKRHGSTDLHIPINPPSFRDVGFCGARKTGEPGEKPSENGENQPQIHYTRTEPRPRPRPHWWEASALDLTTAPKTFLDIIYIPRSPYASSSVSMLVTDHTARFVQFDWVVSYPLSIHNTYIS